MKTTHKKLDAILEILSDTIYLDSWDLIPSCYVVTGGLPTKGGYPGPRISMSCMSGGKIQLLIEDRGVRVWTHELQYLLRP